MATDPMHLIERAAEQLRRSGRLDSSAAQLLGQDASASPALVRTPPALPPEAVSAARGTEQASSPEPGEGALDLQTRDVQGHGLNGAEPPPGIAPSPGTEDEAAPASRAVTLAMLERAGMIDWRNARSRASEELRLVQGQLIRNAFGAEIDSLTPGNLIMVTSARPNEGKTFTALNIACSIARQRDRKVVLVDIDSKPGSVGELIGLRDAPGLLELADEPHRDPVEFLTPTELEYLSILPLGQQTDRAPELFSTRQMSNLIRDLALRYQDRVILLDSAPVLSSSDPTIMAPIVGQIILVVEAEVTQRQEVESAIDLIQSCQFIQLLLNKVKTVRRHGFGSYAGYYGA